jgi:signal transduction histidine kinase
MANRNPFKNTSKWLLALALSWAGVLLLLAGWWIYLFLNFESILASQSRERMIKMITWEGGTFIFLLTMLSFSLLGFYLRDQRKTKSLQAFFASLTHELKTPLASMRLQGEVISELLEIKDDPKLQKLLSRLIQDTNKLETQMDKILQLSRIERGGLVNLTTVKLIPFIKKLGKEWLSDKETEIICKDNNLTIMADEFALELILKNLMENTRIHTQSQKVTINVNHVDKNVVMTYEDQGSFTGEVQKLGSLFYKHNSSKGSGIGLYLSEKLMNKMRGSFIVQKKDNHLCFNLTFAQGEVQDA